jgi:hypothetical protein
MQIHAKVLELASVILAKSEEEILIELTEITNKIVLMALLQEESSKFKRESILKVLNDKLGSGKEGTTGIAVESLSQNYLDSIAESEQKTFIFTTIPDKDDKKETLKENEVDSPTNNS